MTGSRRTFLLALIGASAPFIILARTQAPQMPVPPSQRNREPKDESEIPKSDPKTILESNQKDIKKDVQRLYQLASELKTEVEKTDSAKVLSLAMLRKTEEIERLAKEIRSRAKG